MVRNERSSRFGMAVQMISERVFKWFRNTHADKEIFGGWRNAPSHPQDVDVDRPYYRERQGGGSAPRKISFDKFRDLVLSTFQGFQGAGHFQQQFGYWCVDRDHVRGLLPFDLATYFHMKTGIDLDEGRLLERHLGSFEEADLYTAIEFLFDHASSPLDHGHHHSYSDCGLHLDPLGRFDRGAGRRKWRADINEIFSYFSDELRLSEDGLVLHVAVKGFEPLLENAVPAAVPDTDRTKVERAIAQFRRGSSSREDRKEAVRQLGAVVEFHRPSIKDLVGHKVDARLFTFLNDFSVRHHKPRQVDDYHDAWLNWFFYQLLATIHLYWDLTVEPDPPSEPAQDWQGFKF